MNVRPEAWPEVAYLPLVDAGPCTLAIVRRRDVADPVADELITLAQQTVAHAAQRHAVLGRRPELTAGGLSARAVDDSVWFHSSSATARKSSSCRGGGEAR
jgi:hypothetical protein